MNEHTSGPWQLDQSGNQNLDENYHHISGGCGYHDETGDQIGFGLTGFMSIADARLLTAAPDLLGALLEALEFVEDHEDISDSDDGPLPNRAMRLVVVLRAAIAKATGGAS